MNATGHQARERAVLCQRCAATTTWNVDAICDECSKRPSVASVYDRKHPAVVTLRRRRELAARVDDYVLEGADGIVHSTAGRDVRIAVARAAAALVRVASAKHSAAARAACSHESTFPQRAFGRDLLWCSSCGTYLPQRDVAV